MKSLTLSTFNIRCFGFNGNYFAKFKSDSRISNLKHFIKKHLSDVDVLILQEIMDTRIVNQILGDDFSFSTYPHDYKRHMHVGFAYKKKFSFSALSPVPNTALDNTKSRPVYYGKLHYAGNPIAHIIGVHLKSGSEHSNNRMKQIELLCRFIKELDPSLPVLSAGDFNSRIKEKTGREHDDIHYMEKSLAEISLQRVPIKDITYINLKEERLLDHIWTNAPVKNFWSYNPKTYAEEKSYLKYFKEISDHLPIKVKISLL